MRASNKRARRSGLRTGIKLLAALAGLFLLYQLWMFSQVVWYAYQDPGSSAVMRQELARLRQTNAAVQLQHDWAPYAQINNSLKRAVIASEDANFLEHDGVEWDAIRKAWTYNQRQEELGRAKRRGGSTITQQVAKNLFLSGSRTYFRKGQELILTYMIERVMSKERILELYLNIAEWGVGVFGAQAAAKHYYGISASKLNAAQSARLAAMLPNPRFYDKNRNSSYLASRAAILTRRMQAISIP